MALRTNMLMSQKYRAAFDILFLQFWRTGVEHSQAIRRKQ